MSLTPISDPESVTQTEQAVLAAAIRRQDVRDELLRHANPEWFLSVEHRRIFSAIVTLERNGTGVDPASIIRAVRAGRESIGDVVLNDDWALRSLALGDKITGETFVRNHLPAMRESYMLRQIEALTFEITERVTKATSANDVLTWLAASVDRITEDRGDIKVLTDFEAVDQLLLEVAAYQDDSKFGVLTGITQMDEREIMLAPRQPITLAGRPGHGKSSLGMQMAIGVAQKGLGAAYFALEDGVAGWQDRRAMMMTGAKPLDVRSNKAEASTYRVLESYVRVARERELPLWVFDNDRSFTAYEIIQMARALKRKNPCLGAVFIDQMYDIAGWSETKRGEGRDMAPNRIVDELIRGFRELDVCPVFLQQLNRGGDKGDTGQEPTLKDLADSDAFTKRSRLVLLLWRPNFEDEENDKEVRVKIAKRTNGKRGLIIMDWLGERVRMGAFRDLAVAEARLGRSVA